MNPHKEDFKEMHSMNKVDIPLWSVTFAKVLVSFMFFAVILLSLTPWQQVSPGRGNLIAYDPNDRVQTINSTVAGRIEKWLVRDGSEVKKGEPIVEVVDNDPNFIERLKIERDSMLKKYEVSKVASETSLLNYERQKDLFNQGLSARTKFEKAKIEYKKLLASEATAAANLAKAEVKFSRQKSQLIEAPRDGIILRILHGSGSVIVKEGEVLATFVPKRFVPAAEIYIDGNDLPLVYPGRLVRLQFEGWPAIQFSGWPSVAVGTFGGVVSIVDSSVSANGKFRVIVTQSESESWPDIFYLRQGTRVFGWISLNEVKLGYEIWRLFNGFPASLNKAPEKVMNQSSNIYENK